MADTFTTNYNFRKCEVGADNNTWGGFTNTNWDLLDTTMFAQLALKLALTGGTLSGALNTLDVIPADNTSRKLGSSAKVYSDLFVQQINWYSVAATPTLNGSLVSSGAGWVWKAAGAQTWQWQDVSANLVLSIGSNGTIVFGSVAHQCNLTFNGGASFTGNVSGQNFTATSDSRLKRDVREIDDALTLALQLRGVRFKWVESAEGDEEQFGVIAQEVQKTAPGAVRMNAGKYLGVDYNQLVPILIEGLRILAERVTALEGRHS